VPERVGESTALAAHLRRLRLVAGLSQLALAEKAGVSVATIGAIEEGQRRRPYLHTLRALADSLELTGSERAALLSFHVEVAHSEDVSAPVPPTPLVGRESEIAEASALLTSSTPSVRLLALIGPGGVGKTRLALEVAATVRDAFSDGAVFVDLAPLRDHRLVAATIARVLGVHESGRQSAREVLVAHLRERHLLLTLDNFEHLLGATPLVMELLAACPRLSILVTTRSALRVRSERRLVVPPLATPAAAEALDASLYPAVRLFVERVHNVAPEFTLDSDNAPIVADICRKLDGLPLALELAAARVHLLSPRALLQRLEHRLRLLSSGPVDLPERQRSLRGALDWSYDLLDPPERALFRRLAVFAGGWTLEAAEAVCSDAELNAHDVLQHLSVLVDNSLVRRLDHNADEPRFGMLETIREYALDRLTADAEEVDERNRHLGFYVALAEAAEHSLHGAAQADCADQVEREIDNIRAAIAWSIQTHQALQGLRLVSALRFFWYMRGDHREGREYLQATLVAADATADLATRGHALATLGYMLALQGEYADARSRLQAAVSISRQFRDDTGVAFGLRFLGFCRLG
jgi:predicted ATPase/DNA-binding XRE family transcriptional regulator